LGFLRDSISTFVAQALQALVQVIVAAVLARVLHAEGRGEYGLLVLIPSTAVVVAGLGFGTAALRQVAKDGRIAAAVATNAFLVALCAGAASSAILWTFREPIGAFIGAPGDSIALELALLSIPLLVIDQYVALFLTGIGAIGAANALKLLQSATGLVLLPCFFVWNGPNVASALLAWVTSFLIQDVVAVWVVLQRTGSIARADRGLLKEAMAFGVRTFPASLALYLLFRADLFLVRNWCSLADAGVYSLATSLAVLFQLLGRSVERAFAPRIMAKGEAEAARVTPRVTRTFVLVMTPLALVSVLAAQVLVPLVFGREFDSAATLLALFLPGLLVGNVGILCNSDILSRGHPATGSVAAIGTFAVNVALNVAWIPRYGTLGAACSSLVCYALFGVWMSLAYRRLTGVRLADLFVPTRDDVAALIELVRAYARPRDGAHSSARR
jgi:O-antigen/teichoic acid export membrane protein